MRVSKTDGSRSTTCSGTPCLRRTSIPGISMKTPPQASAMTGPASCLKAIRERDTLIVWKLDRLGRDLRHLVNKVHDLTARGIGFKVLTRHRVSVDITSASGKLVFGIFAALAELGRELIIEKHHARTDLCGRTSERAFPTATHRLSMPAREKRRNWPTDSRSASARNCVFKTVEAPAFPLFF
jgi:Resolvase, N terminal domain